MCYVRWGFCVFVSFFGAAVLFFEQPYRNARAVDSELKKKALREEGFN